ncbi:MAG TPA: hypothetical protein VFA85_12765 [Terriglobales bacterium]|nr:hypothetical protein [Terriglobales bacterium]
MSTFKEHIDAMKYREQELRRKANEFRTKADTIQSERMELEHFIYVEQQKEDKRNEQIRKLVSGA